MYISPYMPDEDRPCYECAHYFYDSFHNEEWCDMWHHIVEGNGTCEKFETWKDVRRKKGILIQLKLFE